MKRGAPSALATPAGELVIRNRQRTRRVNLALLRTAIRAVLARQPGLQAFTLGIHLVSADEMTSLNESFLHHGGSTDIITFDHASRPSSHLLFGELFICMDDAVKHARQFRTSWQSELARYVIHGILHLRGFDDHTPPARRRMKREENRLLREVVARFPLSRLARSSKIGR